MILVDANIVLRYILWDNIEFANKAKEILENEQIILPFEVIAEIVYVLNKVYDVPRKNIHQFILHIINYPNILTNNKKVLEKGLEFYTSSNFDFIDSILLGYNHEEGYKIYSFDKKINKFMRK